MPTTLTGDTTGTATEQVPDAPIAPNGNTTGAAPPVSGVIYDTDGNEIDLAGNINALLSQIQATGFDRAAKLQDQFMQMGGNIDPATLTPNEQTALNDIKDNIARASDADREQLMAVLVHRGMGHSTDVAEKWGGFAATKLIGQATAEAQYLTETAAQKRAQQTSIYDMAARLQTEVMSGSLDYARTLFEAYNATVSQDLNRDQLQLQRDIFEENSWLGRAKFTEEQRQALKSEGFTEQQIALAEQTAGFDMEMRQKEFTASNDLAIKNYDLAKQVQLGQLDLAQVKNNHDMALADRAEQLAETVQLGTLDLESDKFDLYAKQLEREYGLDLNKFELAKFIETGQLNNEILNSQRSYDLADQKQQQDFLLGKGALLLQEELGFRDQDIRYALGQGSITVQHEANLIQQWATKLNIQYQYDALEAQIQANRDAGRGSLLGSIIGGVVRIGAAWLSGGTSEIFKKLIEG